MAIELELLKTACYFSKLDPTSLSQVGHYLFERSFDSGEAVLWEEERDEVLYFVIAGLVKLFTTSAEGREFVVRIVYGGDSVNDDSVFDGGANVLSAMAMSPVRLYGLRREDLYEILRLFPQVNTHITEVFAARQRYLVRLATELVFKNVTGRLAHLILERENLAQRGNSEVKITQQEMASIIGTVREIVSRSLRELEAEGIVSLNHNEIAIKNREKLKELNRL